jgi:parallel beta-helix repeat protein
MPELPSDPNSARSFRNAGNRGGVMFLAQREGGMKNINFVNLTVKSCTYNGVFVSGAAGVNVLHCDFNENGSSVVPGPRLQHNLLLTHCSGVVVKDCRLDTSPYGSGISLSRSRDAQITGCEVARNAYYGIVMAECSNILITGNLVEANDRSGVMVEFLCRGSENISVSDNLIHYNDGHGVEAYAVSNIKVLNNTYAGNANSEQKVSNEKIIVMK